MKKNLTILCFFITLISFGQTITEINAHLGLPDSFESKSELRIYKRYAITNSTDVFRIYLAKNNIFKAELYSFHNAVAGYVEKASFEKTALKCKDIELARLKIMLSNIEHLPKWDAFQYKLSKPQIVFKDGEYQILTTTRAISDGVSYNVFVKWGETINEIEYSNPESTLKSYPGVDELEMFSQLLTIIREEFDIWKDER